ncbi:MAG: hypothetical protein U0263_15815 [Polyangiaceae bacterium]
MNAAHLVPFSLALANAACGMAVQQAELKAKAADDSPELGAPLAVGGTIHPNIRATLDGTASPSLLLVSGHPEIVSAEDGKLTGRSPGMTAILVTTREGVVVDFHHLWVERATRATLHRLYADGREMGEVSGHIDVILGEPLYLTPKLYFGAQELAGAVEGKWSVEPPLVHIYDEGVAQRRRLVAERPGVAVLRLELPGAEAQVSFRVVDPNARKEVPEGAT